MLSYSELLQRCEVLETENRKLREENAELRSRLHIPVADNAVEIMESTGSATESAAEHNRGAALESGQRTVMDNGLTFSVHRNSSAEEKIRLFQSLFRGRDDVFARRWHNAAKQTSGYQPVCENEWMQGVCDKKEHRCAECPNRVFTSLTDEHVYRHLAGKDYYGRDVIGVYPLLEDETCFFLCMDFDDGEYEKDVQAVRSVCRQLQLPVYVERSRSGGGAHVWFFFEEATMANEARKMGACLLTVAMEQRSSIKFSSYDRMLPNQDYMPKGGFGNLIALPLQGQARKKGNSVFVDENFIPYDDQWAFLSMVEKIPTESLERVISKFEKDGYLGHLVNADNEKPWELKKEKVLSAFDFTKTVHIVWANMLYVKKDGISETALNEIKRLAAFKNPEFYRAQALRLSLYGKPRIICTAEDYDDYLAIPRGCESALVETLERSGAEYEFDDQTNHGITIHAEFQGSLREEQEPAADALLSENTGVLSATTAFGKTVIAANLIARRKTNTLILVHTQALMNQWKTSLEQFLQLDVPRPEAKPGRGRRAAWSPVGQLGGGKNSLHGVVDIAMMQSLVSEHEVRNLVRDYGMVIVDECHHVSAVNFEKVMKHVTAKYVYGLTATPVRQDGHQAIIFMQCGPVRYLVDARSQAMKRPFAHYLVPRFTKSRVDSGASTHISAKYKALVQDMTRNAMILRDVKETLAEGRTPLILTERKEHVILLSDMLKGECEHVFALTGGAGMKEKREILNALAAVPAGEPVTVVATGKYVGEGFDYPRLDTLFLALPIAWKGTLAQYAGRLHRNYEGKSEVRIYDYIDAQIPEFDKMYQKRMKGYAAIGYQVKTECSVGDDEARKMFFDSRDYSDVFLNDLESARASIIIVSPRLHPQRIKKLMDALLAARGRGVALTLMTNSVADRPEKDQKLFASALAMLEEYGIQIQCREGLYQRLAVIDSKFVWYGSVDFLAYGWKEDNLMRFEDGVIAGELMGELKL